jgi:hypothetical protein
MRCSNVWSCPLFLASAALGLTGCRPMSADLEPAATAETIPRDDDAAQASEHGLAIVAEATTWPGEGFITQRVTPLRVTITNGSDRMVLIHYRDIELVGSSGQRYRALPPIQINGTVDSMDPHIHAVEPGLEYRDFAVADRYVPAYPGIRTFNGAFAYDRDYYQTYYPHWHFEEALPTPEMILAALPEGVIEPGGYVSGWLYFHKVDAAEAKVQLHADLHPVDDEAPIAELWIPFRTE